MEVVQHALRKIFTPGGYLVHFPKITRVHVLYIIAALFITAPLIALLFSLLGNSSVAWEYIASTVLTRYVIHTILFSLSVTLLASCIGIYAAWLVCTYDFPFRSIIKHLLLLPKAIPVYIAAYSFAGFTDVTGPFQMWLRNILGFELHSTMLRYSSPYVSLILIMSIMLYPYVYLAARIAFTRQPRNLLETSLSLGRDRKAIFWKISLPIGRPVIITGILIVFMEVINDYAALAYYGVETITTGIFRSWFLYNDLHLATIFAVFLLAITGVVIIIEQSLRKRKLSASAVASFPYPRCKVSTGKSIAYTLCTITPVLLGFALPVYQLLYWTTINNTNTAFWGLLGSTILTATIVTVTCLFYALILAYTSYLLRKSPISKISSVFSCGYVMPGSIIGVGVLILTTYTAADSTSSPIQSLLSGILPWIMTGSLPVLIYAYMVRYLAIAHYSFYNFLTSNHSRFDEASRSLGTSAIRTLTRVHMPLMRSVMFGSGMLIFTDVLRDLPITIILRPFNFQTLSVKIHELAVNEQLPQIALPSLILIGFGLLAITIIIRWEKIILKEKNTKQ